MNVIWSPLALDKIGQTAEYIALDNPSAAEKWVNDVFDKAENLGSFPELGRLVPELN
ncbi:type II toxin-antitoxin system RelE/ParE family toxin, partial [Aliivibrio sifiae]